MSCEQSPNRISRLASQVGAGIVQLANKRAFYAGLALGGTGLIGAGLIALAVRLSAHDEARRQSAGRRNKKPQRKKTLQGQLSMQPIPQLPTRTKISPASNLSSSDRCARCQTSRESKQGSWYSIDGRTYCQDCAPEAARQVDVDLIVPERELPGVGGTSTASARQSDDQVRIPVRRGGTTTSSRSYPAYLPPERRVKTRLARSRLRLNVGQNPNGRPAWFVVDNGHVLLRPDGSDTGLAITPTLKLGQVSEGVQQVEEDTGRWWLTHIPSGKTLGSHPYASVEEAQLLGSVLAQLDWTRPENEISADEIRRVSETVRRYNQALAEEKGHPRHSPSSAAPTFVSGSQAATTSGSTTDASRRPVANEDLTGKLMADGYGGVARVLDATRNGETLFMVDSLGKRYEVGRDQIRTPDASDFEMCRVAMSFDPAKQAETPCVRCGQSSHQADGGKWYRMGWKDFCSSCAAKYAAEEGYIKDDEVNSDLEPMA